MKNQRLLILGVALFVFGLACSRTIAIGSPTQTPMNTATPDLIATQNVAATEQARLEHFSTVAANATDQAYLKQTATAEAVAEATSIAQPVQETVQRLVQDGYLQDGEGEFYNIGNFTEQTARINYLQSFSAYGLKLDDFVIVAEIEIQSAYEKANLFNSACGFIFHAEDPTIIENFYFARIAMDGFASFDRFNQGVWADEVKYRWGQGDAEAVSARMVLVVEGDWIYIFVNDELVIEKYDPYLDDGYLLFGILSGTNTSFGTRCIMRHVGLWDLSPEYQRFDAVPTDVNEVSGYVLALTQ